MVLPIDRTVARFEAAPGEAEPLAAMVQNILHEAQSDLGDVRLARFAVERSPRPLLGIEGAPDAVVVGGPLPHKWLAGRTIWLDVGHPLLQRAIVMYAARPAFAAYAVAVAAGARLSLPALGAEKLTDAVASAIG